MPYTPRTMYYHKEMPPCKDCQDRQMGCHSKCERFAKWKEQTNDSRTQATNHYKADRDCDGYEGNKKIRLAKRYKR
jgi:hypothetical protein